MINLRHQQIIEIARRSGKVTVEDLAQRFEVTPQTIRKDLNDLCDERLLSRIHGGAILSSGVENVAYDARRNLAASEKQMIGAKAASLVPNGSSLFINIGTTTEEVARNLVNHQELLAITNNIHVASILLPCTGIEVIIAGGMLRKSDGGVVGETAIDFISQFKVDYAVIGVSAIDGDGSLLDFDYREVRAAQAIIQNARTVILVADNTKFSRTAPVRIGHLREIDMFITDLPPSPAILEICQANDVRVETVLPAPVDEQA
jgi:DeoR family transcriptional regulator, glycerol-3-phosphate regulon repressor